MKSFSPAGMAVKAYVGLGARTFGNPTGATSGNGGFPNPGPPPPPPPVNFTFRGNPAGAGVKTYAMQTDGAGNTLLITLTGQVWKSTDGGHTWSHLSNLSGGFAPVQSIGNLVFVGGTWLLGEDGFVNRSSDGGLIFSRQADGITNAGGVVLASRGILGGFNHWLGVGNIVQAGGATNMYGTSADDGLTWSTAANVTHINGLAYPSIILWDGTQYIFGSQDGSNVARLQTSLDGFTWTITPMNDPTLMWTAIYFIGGTYYAVSWQDSTQVGVCATVAELTNPPTMVDTGLAPAFFMHAGTQWIAAGFFLGVSGAPDPVAGPWQVGALNMPAPNNETVNAVYDPVNNSVIVAGDQGGIATLP